ncbi:MAG: ribonuclease P protein component [Bacteroidota bacterium]
MSLQTFGKSERLHKKKEIKELFDKGSSFYLYPFKVLHLTAKEETVNPKILISVSKRSFKRAVDRNKVKRLIREAYRINKHNIQSKQNLLIAYIYTPKEILSFSLIEKKLKQVLSRLNDYYTDK